MRKSPDIRYASAYEMKESLLKLGLGAGKRGDETAKQAGPTALAEQKSGPKHKVDKRLRLLIIALVVLVFLTGIYSVFTIFRALARGEEVSVPNVTGYTKEAAITALTQAGLGYTLDGRADNVILKNYVISQSIAGGQKVKKDRVIALVISEGPQLLRIPDVTGLLQREAQVTLTNNGLTGSFTEDFHDAVPVGRVISQSPTGGTEITAGAANTTVSVVISKGPAGVLVPNLLGQDLTAARAALKTAGLAEGTIQRQNSDQYYAGVVIGQSAAAQSTVAKDTAIDLTVSTGPGPAAKTAQITYTVANDGANHQLRIVVEDASGTHEEYNQALAPGTAFKEYITFYGEGKIIVYVDGKQVSTHAVP